MKLLATNSVQSTDKVNIGLILNDGWQIPNNSQPVNPKQGKGDRTILDYTDTGYIKLEFGQILWLGKKIP